MPSYPSLPGLRSAVALFAFALPVWHSCECYVPFRVEVLLGRVVADFVVLRGCCLLPRYCFVSPVPYLFADFVPLAGLTRFL